MRILVVSPKDEGGGAESTAQALCRGYRARGHDAYLVVGEQRGLPAQDVVALPGNAARNAWTRTLLEQSRNSPWPPVSKALYVAGRLGEPLRLLRKQLGGEDMDFPGSRVLLPWAPQVDAIHLHNLHGDYFDLRMLPALSGITRTVVTLHDMWLLTGHCAHAMDCPRFAVGCGHCPDLVRYPSVHADATALNRRRKAALLAQSHGLTLAAPSRWLLGTAQAALPAARARWAHVPHGVDRSVFHAKQRDQARAQLGLAPDAFVVAWDGTANRTYRDAATARAALAGLRVPNLVVLQTGDGPPAEVLGQVRALGRVPGPEMARLLRAADVYLHPSKADSYPSAVLEAQACGAAVVATAVGGIPEQVTHNVTGLLCPVGEPAALQAAMDALARAPGTAAALGANAAAQARSMEDTVETYLALLEGRDSASHQPQRRARAGTR